MDSAGQLIALLISREFEPTQTTFFTAPDAAQQVGCVVYPPGGQVQRHFHVPRERKIVGTPEVIIVRSGRCSVELYGLDRTLLTTKEMTEGDVIVLVRGGHGFRMHEETVLLEVKQGPYDGAAEKVRF